MSEGHRLVEVDSRWGRHRVLDRGDVLLLDTQTRRRLGDVFLWRQRQGEGVLHAAAREGFDGSDDVLLGGVLVVDGVRSWVPEPDKTPAGLVVQSLLATLVDPDTPALDDRVWAGEGFVAALLDDPTPDAALVHVLPTGHAVPGHLLLRVDRLDGADLTWWPHGWSPVGQPAPVPDELHVLAEQVRATLGPPTPDPCDAPAPDRVLVIGRPDDGPPTDIPTAVHLLDRLPPAVVVNDGVALSVWWGDRPGEPRVTGALRPWGLQLMSVVADLGGDALYAHAVSRPGEPLVWLTRPMPDPRGRAHVRLLESIHTSRGAHDTQVPGAPVVVVGDGCFAVAVEPEGGSTAERVAVLGADGWRGDLVVRPDGHAWYPGGCTPLAAPVADPQVDALVAGLRENGVPRLWPVD